MKLFIEQKDWLKLPDEWRKKLVYTFYLGKSEGVVVQMGQIVSDGCTQRDLMAFNVQALINFLGDDWEKVPNAELFDHLFAKVLQKLFNADGRSETKDVRVTTEGKVGTGTVEGQQRKRRGRPALSSVSSS